MSRIATGNELGEALLKAFGLDPGRVTKVVLTCEANSVAQVALECVPDVPFPEDGWAKQITENYKIVKIEPLEGCEVDRKGFADSVFPPAHQNMPCAKPAVEKGWGNYPTRLELEDGKYTVVIDSKAGVYEALRHGETWRNLTGDKLILAMFDRVVELEAELESLRSIYDETVKNGVAGFDALVKELAQSKPFAYAYPTLRDDLKKVRCGTVYSDYSDDPSDGGRFPLYTSPQPAKTSDEVAEETVRDAKLYRALRAMHWNDKKLCVTDPKNVRLGSDTFSGDRLDEAVGRFINEEPNGI